MEAQSLVFGLCSNSPIPSFENPKVPCIFTLPSSSFSPSSSLCNRCPKMISLKTHHSFPSHKVASNLFKCRNSVEKAESSSDYGGDARTGVGNIKKKLAVFVSGGGSNFRSIHEATLSGSVYGDIVILVTNKHDCGGALYAKDKGIPVILFPKLKGKPEGLSSNDLVNALRRYEVDFILLAGYLKLIPSELIRAYPKCILNIHPSLLPAFGGNGYYGIKVHKGVIASGARYSGPTVHFVDENYDTGRILAQRVVPVLAKDTPEELAARVLYEEHKVYVEVVEALCDNRIIWREDGVPLIRSKQNPNDYG